MVSPVTRRLRGHDPPQSARALGHKTPMGMTVVSPTESETDSPLTIGPITPTRRLLFERGPHTSLSKRSAAISVDSRQDSELQALKLSNERKDSQLRVLHERFHHIQQGLGSIDQERGNLVEKAKKLEKEKKHIQRQLELREREILVLVKRCASQEEKMRESSRLRAQNKELAEALESVQNQMQNTTQEKGNLTSLRKQLQASELAREELQGRLRRIQKEHDSIADTLQECLENIRQLTDEKQEIEDERRREKKRAEIEMEKQRLAHVQEANTLKDNLESKQHKIDQMEKILQESMHSKNFLRRERAVEIEERETVVAKYEEQIRNLQLQIGRADEETTKNLEKEIEDLRRKIVEKDAIVAGLENEFSGQMDQLMKKQGSLDEVEEEKKTLQSRVQKLEGLESEHSALVEYVRILDSNLADLTSENAHLILEKDTLKEDAERLERKTKELEFQLYRSNEHPQAQDHDLHRLAESDDPMDELQLSLDQARKNAKDTEEELEVRRNWTSKLENQLQESRKALIQKEQEINQLQREKEEETNSLNITLDQARQEIQQLETAIRFRDNELASMSMKADMGRPDQISSDAILDDARREPPPFDEYGALARENERLLMEVKIRESDELVKSLDEEIQSLTAKCSNLEDTAEAERESKSASEYKKRELEISLQKAKRDLLSYEEQVKSLLQANHSLELEAEAGKLSMNKAEQGDVKLSAMAAETRQLKGELAMAREKLYSYERVRSELEQANERLLDQSDTLETVLEESETHKAKRAQAEEALKNARATIKSLEEQLEQADNSKVERRLSDARSALTEQQEKTLAIEQEYAKAMQVQSEREIYNRQVSSKIAVLEDQIVELKAKAAEAKEEVVECEKKVALKDRRINLLELEKEEMEKRALALNSKIEDGNEKLAAAEMEISKRGDLHELLKIELQEVQDSLQEREGKILAIEDKLSVNEAAKNELSLKLDESKSTIDRLEEDIKVEKSRSESLDEQLKSALKSLAENDDFVRQNELKVAEKSLKFTELEQRFDQEVSSKVELERQLSSFQTRVSSMEETAMSESKVRNELEKTVKEAEERVKTVEQEKEALQRKCEALLNDLESTRRTSDERYGKLEELHAKACTSLATKQTEIVCLEESRNEIESEKDDFELQLQDAQEEITLLEEEVRTRDERIEGLEQEIVELSKNDIELAFVESEEKRMKLENQLKEANQKIESLMTNLAERESRLMTLDSKLDEITKERNHESERANETSERCSELEDRIKDLDSLIEKREAQMLDLGNQLNVTKDLVEDKDKETTNLRNVVESLETALEETNRASDLTREKLESQLSEERSQNVEINAKLRNTEMKADENAKKLSNYQSVVLEQDDKIEKLQKQLTETLDTMETTNKELTEHFNSEIAKLETDVALKDDEIRNLRVIELKDKEETITTLSEALEKLKSDYDQREGETNTTINELKRENESLTSKVQEVQTLEEAARNEFKRSIQDLHMKIEGLELDQQQAESRLSEQDIKLKERHKIIQDLTKREAELEQQEQVLMASCEQLVKSETNAKEELEKLKNALDMAITRAKEDLQLQREEMERGRRREVDELGKKLKSTEEKLNESEFVLQERTSLLGDMVEHNKDLETKLDKQQAQIMAMEHEGARTRKDLSESQKELSHAREELCKRENTLTAKLNEERAFRDTAERSLVKLKAQYKEAVRTKKTIAELEKDNAALKDKITRQEAYLQRKLQKEKTQRGQRTSAGGAPSPVGKSRNVSSVTPGSIVARNSPQSGRFQSSIKTPSSTPRNGTDQSLRSTARSLTSSLLAPRATATVSTSSPSSLKKSPSPSKMHRRATPTGSMVESRQDDGRYSPIGSDLDLEVE